MGHLRTIHLLCPKLQRDVDMQSTWIIHPLGGEQFQQALACTGAAECGVGSEPAKLLWNKCAVVGDASPGWPAGTRLPEPPQFMRRPGT